MVTIGKAGETDETGNETTRLRLCINYRANNLVDSCGARGSRELAAALKKGLAERSLPFELETSHCMSKCHIGPTLRVLPNGPFIMGCREDDVPEILDHLDRGDIDGLAAKFPLIERDRTGG